jgi:preprotein translocase subunit SecE
VSKLTTILIWCIVILAVFGLLWWQGAIARLRNYWNETREELHKCTWPTWDELKGSTILVAVTSLLLGVFTFLVDQVASFIVLSLT